MPRIAIKGLVRLADDVRRSLSNPASVSEVTQLKQHVTECLGQLQVILRRHGANLGHIGRPSRNAVRFLQQIDWSEQIARCRPAADAGPSPANIDQSTSRDAYRGAQSETFRLHGTRRKLEHWLGMLQKLREQGVDRQKAVVRLAQQLGDEVRTIRSQMEKHALEPVNLRLESRQYFGWCRYFRKQAACRRYCLAADWLASRLTPGTGPRGETGKIAGRPIDDLPIIHFRPMKGLYRCTFAPPRQGRRQVTLAMPTSMISFRKDDLNALADWLRGRSAAKHQVLEATRQPRYQRLVRLLDMRHAEPAAGGMYHDLRASFDRVNSHYFGGTMESGNLRWGRVAGGTHFGFYESSTDSILISATLDAADVPAFVLDFVVYHECLHKILGTELKGASTRAHTPEFRRRERQFQRFDEAETMLKGIAQRRR